MNLKPLLLYIKQALDNEVSPEEVAIQLQKQESTKKNKDDDNETVDSEAIEVDSPNKNEAKNVEGQIMEMSFKELAVEDAVEKAQEQKNVG